ncbi:MAG: deoxyribonuclease IV [Nitrospirae bacterium]|nr:deoxyribonuclease IV [Nitrospirota bacterium]
MGRGKGKVPLLGVHTSISGGISLSLKRAEKLGCNTMQIFCHSPRSWDTPEPDEADIRQFRNLRKSLGISPVFIHCSYLINLSSPDKGVRTRSIKLLAYELMILEQTGADYLVLHPGRAVGQPIDVAIKLASEAIKEATTRAGVKGRILLENTAGQKGDIYSTIENLSIITEKAGPDSIGGLCIDTCHAFQAGYDITTREGCDSLYSEIEEFISPLKIKLIHLNDSKRPLSSGIDRHEHIGLGYIGDNGFRVFLNHPMTRGIPLILETPKKTEKDDVRNLKKVKELLE